MDGRTRASRSFVCGLFAAVIALTFCVGLPGNVQAQTPAPQPPPYHSPFNGEKAATSQEAGDFGKLMDLYDKMKDAEAAVKAAEICKSGVDEARKTSDEATKTFNSSLRAFIADWSNLTYPSYARERITALMITDTNTMMDKLAKEDKSTHVVGQCPPKKTAPALPRATPAEVAPVKTGMAPPCNRSGAVLAEINAARTDPASYARSWPMGGRVGDVSEALAFLNRQAPLPPLTASPQLDGAAARHAADQGPSDRPGHTGTDGSGPRDRIQAAGVFSMIVTEEISVDQDAAAGVVRQLIVDAGNPSHMHRADLFSPLEMFAGVGCAANRAFHTITVIDLAGAVMQR